MGKPDELGTDARVHRLAVEIRFAGMDLRQAEMARDKAVTRIENALVIADALGIQRDVFLGMLGTAPGTRAMVSARAILRQNPPTLPEDTPGQRRRVLGDGACYTSETACGLVRLGLKSHDHDSRLGSSPRSMLAADDP
jgi:hypothetical protein